MDPQLKNLDMPHLLYYGRNRYKIMMDLCFRLFFVLRKPIYPTCFLTNLIFTKAG